MLSVIERDSDNNKKFILKQPKIICNLWLIYAFSIKSFIKMHKEIETLQFWEFFFTYKRTYDYYTVRRKPYFF